VKWTELAEPYIFRFMEKQKLVEWELFLMTSPQRRFGKRTLCPWVKDQNQSGSPISLQCGQGSLMIGQKCN
jgi:hypothetical protein